MAAPANAVRFFGVFNFMTPSQTGQSMPYIVHLSALRSGSSRGTGSAYSRVMSDKTEKMNTQNGGL
ncbi:MAG TPA: hypothetical protein VN203_25620, partial [Candidatus Acidoferrum sp.]|nr:hypothetical protein [Candidatus Acidoferrum sp.]